MSITAKDLDHFVAFARQAVERNACEIESLSELLWAWEVERIRLSEGDDALLRTTSVDEAFAEIRRKLGWEK